MRAILDRDDISEAGLDAVFDLIDTDDNLDICKNEMAVALRAKNCGF